MKSMWQIARECNEKLLSGEYDEVEEEKTDQLLDLLTAATKRGFRLAIRPNSYISGSFTIFDYTDEVLCETRDPVKVLQDWIEEIDTVETTVSYSLAPEIEDTASDMIVGIQGALIDIQHRLAKLAAETRRVEEKADLFIERNLRLKGVEDDR